MVKNSNKKKKNIMDTAKKSNNSGMEFALLYKDTNTQIDIVKLEVPILIIYDSIIKYVSE